MEGLLLVDKPSGISSFRVVSRIRGIIKAESGQRLKVGHSGTLDPLATGLLLIAVGKYTKKIPKLIYKDKTYYATAKLGQVSTTGDKEGEIKKTNLFKPSEEQIIEALEKFKGKMLQTPPIYSAVKVNGQRAYKLARKGQEVSINPKEVTIFKNKLIKYEYPFVEFETKVSGGTYIRSLIEDIGKSLNTGAYMYELKRTQIGDFSLSNAIALEELNYSKIESSLITLED